jgi:hypothetical protein
MPKFCANDVRVGTKLKGTFDEAMKVFFIKPKEDKKNEASE